MYDLHNCLDVFSLTQVVSSLRVQRRLNLVLIPCLLFYLSTNLSLYPYISTFSVGSYNIFWLFFSDESDSEEDIPLVTANNGNLIYHHLICFD